MNEVQWNDLAHRLKTVLLQLSNESTIFERLVYKNTNQHRRSLYFRRLVQVRRELRLLQAARLSQLIENVGECHKIMTESRDGETVTIEINDLKRRVYGAVSLTQQITEAALCSGIKVATLLGQTFFMPFALTALAVLARLWVLSQQALYDFARLFNMLATWPKRVMEKGDHRYRKLPSHLDCKWDDDGKIFICAHPPQETAANYECQEFVPSSSVVPEEEEDTRKQLPISEPDQNIARTCEPDSTIKKVAYVSVCKIDDIEAQKPDDEGRIAKKLKTDVFYDMLLGLQDTSKNTIF